VQALPARRYQQFDACTQHFGGVVTEDAFGAAIEDGDARASSSEMMASSASPVYLRLTPDEVLRA
jgi:hypothetical protein